MTAPGPIASWRNICKVRFQLRVEEFDDIPPELDSLEPGSGTESFGLAQEHQEGAGFLSVGYDIIPFSVSVDRNSYRLADEARVSIPFSKMPFNPDLIRAATVQIFGGPIDALTWAQAMDGPGASGLILPDTNQRGESHELFRGFVDDWQSSITPDGDNTVDITARDITSIFVDADLPANSLKGVDKATRIDEVIRILIYGDGLPESKSRVPGLRGARGTVVVSDIDGDLPKLSEIRPPSWFTSSGTVATSGKRKQKNAKKESYWDMITDLCVSSGFICFIRPGQKPQTLPDGRLVVPGAEIVITNPRTYYAKSINFGDQRVPPATVRQFWQGLNVDSLSVRRNYSGNALPSTIEVRTFDVSTGVQFKSRFPIKSKNNRPSTSGKGDREEIKVFVIEAPGGDKIQETLDAVAVSIYEQLARGEIEVQISTVAPAALPWNISGGAAEDADENSGLGIGGDPDMFRLKAGDPIFVGVDRANIEEGRVSQHTLFSTLASDAKVDSMVRAGIREDVARKIANAADSQWVQHEFRLQKLNLSYDNDEGWNFELNAINYLDVRNAVQNGE